MTSLLYDDVSVGDQLTSFSLPLTRSLIVATALASRDFQDVHHDPALAQDKGSQDIFMNILTTNGLIGRYITDWAGADAVIKNVSIRLGAPNYAGDTMTLSGTVTVKEAGQVVISVVGANSLGNHVTGTVTLVLASHNGRGAV